MRPSRDEIGEFVRNVWIAYCTDIGDSKPSHFTPYAELSEADKEADRRIGTAVWDYAIRTMAMSLEINPDNGLIGIEKENSTNG